MAVNSDTKNYMNTLHVKAPPLPNPKVSFIASLSNGQTVIEHKGHYAWIDGQPSPWQRLIKYTIENKLTINSLSLFTPHGATYTIPPAGGKPKFTGYNKKDEVKPIDFEVKRFLAREMTIGAKDNKAEVEKTDIAEFYTIAEAIYPDFILQLWVDELDPRHSWVVIKGGK